MCQSPWRVNLRYEKSHVACFTFLSVYVYKTEFWKKILWCHKGHEYLRWVNYQASVDPHLILIGFLTRVQCISQNIHLICYFIKLMRHNVCLRYINHWQCLQSASDLAARLFSLCSTFHSFLFFFSNWKSCIHDIPLDLFSQWWWEHDTDFGPKWKQELYQWKNETVNFTSGGILG